MRRRKITINLFLMRFWPFERENEEPQRLGG
jgi:hypothetical protein